MPPRVLLDPEARNLAGKYIVTFQGPGGFTQAILMRTEAEAIARALDLPLVVCRPGTTLPA